MKETYYFSHDYNARNDEKIIKLIQNQGWQGYGIFWAVIEKLYEADGFLDKDYDCIAFDLRTDSERIKQVIESGLFKFSKEKFYSDSVLARLRVRKGKSEQARQSAFLRWNKLNKDDANALRTQSEGNAIKESKVKEKKVKKISTIVDRETLEVVDNRNQDINWIIGEFESVMKFKSAGTKDRFMAKHLLNNFSREQLTAMLTYCATQEYAPRIGSVEKLWYKRGDIIAGIKSLNNKNNIQTL
jgi:hypothetical protein